MNYFKSPPVFILVLLANIASSYDGVLIDNKRIETIKYRIEHRTEPTYSTLTHGTPLEIVFEGKPYTDGDTFADTWVATDALGRESPSFRQCGPVKKDKWTGIFYWTWHTPGRGGPYDNTKILEKANGGEVIWPPKRGSHHWAEPELGYYLMTDPFVIRKHASMLVDAGIDAVLFDTTNPPFTWKDEYDY